MTHFSNHALGLISVAAAEAGRWWFLALWRNPLGTLVLYLALLTHPILGLVALYRRRTLRMPLAEALQLVLGLSVPLLVAGHVVGTRVAHTLFGREDAYTWLTFALWNLRPDIGFKHALLVVIVWTHACIGLHYWLRLRPWYRAAIPVVYASAVLLPALAFGGFARMGREVAAWSEPVDVARRQAALKAASLPPQAQASLWDIELTIYLTFAGALAAVLLARSVRVVLSRRRQIRIAYPGGRSVTVPVGFTILEASRFGGIPHVSVCGGRGRCSTCRVRIERGADMLPPPRENEARLLRRVAAPPTVRLACQTRPVGEVAVTPVITPAPTHAALEAAGAETGREREIAVLFADLRGFTSLAERKLPYDVVYLLNRYFEAVGGAIRDAGGVANQFTGDGVMALFGIDASPEVACRDALRGAAGMIAALETLSRTLADELPAPLRLGVGIHVGPAVVGRMGYAEGRDLTAVGDTVNAAARLEQLTKEYDCALVISDVVAVSAGVDVSGYPNHVLALRNRAEVLSIRVIADVASLRLPPR